MNPLNSIEGWFKGFFLFVVGVILLSWIVICLAIVTGSTVLMSLIGG